MISVNGFTNLKLGIIFSLMTIQHHFSYSDNHSLYFIMYVWVWMKLENTNLGMKMIIKYDPRKLLLVLEVSLFLMMSIKTIGYRVSPHWLFIRTFNTFPAAEAVLVVAVPLSLYPRPFRQFISYSSSFYLVSSSFLIPFSPFHLPQISPVFTKM